MQGGKNTSVRKKKLGSYPAANVVFSITLALTFIGAFGCLLIYSRELERVVRENVKIQVYLHSQLRAADREKLEKIIREKPYTLASGKGFQFISREEAARQFIQETGEDFEKFLGENPLRDAFLVPIDPQYHTAGQLAEIKRDLEKIKGVFEVYYVESVIQSIQQNVTKIGLVLAGLGFLLLVTVLLLIHNTLRLALFSQRFLIRSMQLVGATHRFIQRPFLWKSVLHGLTAGVLASALLLALLAAAHRQIEDLHAIQNRERLLLLGAGLIVTGIAVSMVGTYRAVQKYLKLSLDELY